MPAQNADYQVPGHPGITPGVNPEISKILRKQTQAERQKLEALILRDGIQDPVIVWEETGEILDGHNRVDIAAGNNAVDATLEYDIEYVSLPDLDAAIEYVLERQEGKRNATPQDMAYSRGKLYDRRKKQGERTDLTSAQNEQKSAATTGEDVGKETGASNATTRRDAEYSRAVDALTKVFGRDFQAHVLSGESKLSKTDVVMLAGELGKNDEVLYSAAELWAFGHTGTFKLAMLLARCRAECGEETYSALWEPSEDDARVRVSTAQLEHLLTMPDDETAADLVEIVESGQPIEDPKAGKIRVVASVQDAHKLRQEERRKAEREAGRAAALALVQDSEQCTVTDVQAVIQCDALITDPPYGILSKEEWDTFESLEDFSREWLSRWNECGADFIVSFWSQEYLFEGRRWFDEELANYEFTQVLTWVYRNNKKPQSQRMFKQTWEPVFFYRRKDTDKLILVEGETWGGDLHNLDTHIAATPQSNFNDVDSKEHPAQKPLSAMRWLVGATTSAGDLVVDPFCGSGTTGIAALQLERRFAGIETNPRYRELSNGRLAQFGV